MKSLGVNHARGIAEYKKLLHIYFTKYPIEFKVHQGQSFDVGDMFKNNPIPEPTTQGLSVEIITNLEWELCNTWHTYFKSNIHSWKALSREQTTAFVNRFYEQYQPVLPLDHGKIDQKQLNIIFSLSLNFKSTDQLSLNRIHWLNAIHENLGDFLSETQRIMIKKTLFLSARIEMTLGNSQRHLFQHCLFQHLAYNSQLCDITLYANTLKCN